MEETNGKKKALNDETLDRVVGGDDNHIPADDHFFLIPCPNCGKEYQYDTPNPGHCQGCGWPIPPVFDF